MKSSPVLSGIWAVTAIFFLLPALATVVAADFPDPPEEPAAAASSRKVAVLAGGCFWGVEGVFERLRGVLEVASGYAGGREDTARYDMVSTGGTGHAESVRIVYDPSLVGYGTLLKVFFSVAHDPTQLNRQGPDAGTQYRSAIFYTDADQKRVAESYIRRLDRSKVFPKRIVTQVVPLKGFFEAEDYHQDFMDRNPLHPYVLRWDRPKIAHLEREFADLLARDGG